MVLRVLQASSMLGGRCGPRRLAQARVVVLRMWIPPKRRVAGVPANTADRERESCVLCKTRCNVRVGCGGRGGVLSLSLCIINVLSVCPAGPASRTYASGFYVAHNPLFSYPDLTSFFLILISSPRLAQPRTFSIT